MKTKSGRKGQPKTTATVKKSNRKLAAKGRGKPKSPLLEPLPKTTTSLELDADMVAKLRAILKATSGESPEKFLERWIRDAIASEPEIGLFLGMIRKEFREEAKEKIRRILANDRRLVRPEPMAKNAFLHSVTVGAIKTLAADPAKNPIGISWEAAADTLLYEAARRFEDKITWRLSTDEGTPAIQRAETTKEKGGKAA